MLAVVASCRDPSAEALARRWAAHDARLLTPDDLAVPGWRYHPGAPEAAAAVVAGEVVAVDRIAGVLIRLPRVEERDLARIVPAERAYVAAEMTAFLTAWLAELTCPVLNRPSPACLAGPGWWPERWLLAAAELGLPVRALRRRVALGRAACPAAPNTGGVTATVVGDRCLGPVPARLAAQARAIAEAAGVDLLAVRFSGDGADAAVLGADPWPDVAPPAVADAVLAYLLRGAGR